MAIFELLLLTAMALLIARGAVASARSHLRSVAWRAVPATTPAAGSLVDASERFVRHRSTEFEQAAA